ncbi:MAG TPA: redoxin domain-containing protein [Thermoanaerobaculia bacterium]
MKRTLIVASLLALALLVVRGALYVGAFSSADDAPAHAAPAIGKAAPEFAAADTYGKTHSLSQYRGKWVVLEWLNHGCP